MLSFNDTQSEFELTLILFSLGELCLCPLRLVLSCFSAHGTSLVDDSGSLHTGPCVFFSIDLWQLVLQCRPVHLAKLATKVHGLDA